MSDVIRPWSIAIVNCAPECECQAVHLDFCDPDGDIFASGNLSPEIARSIAKDLLKAADLADAQRLRLKKRLL